MKTVPETCIIDNTVPRPFEANGLPLLRCPLCDLAWRTSFDLPPGHYEDAAGGFSITKERLQRRNIQDRIRTLVKYISLDDTCDVGGSKGYFVEALLQKGCKNVYGVDPNREQVSAAQLRGVPMLVGSTADMANLFKERQTQNVTLFHVIEHLAEPEKNVKEIYDALPTGGHLVVETPDFGSYVLRERNYRHQLIYPEHLFYFNFQNLQAFLQKQGFKIIYAGKRDFDRYNLNVHESLFRLGWRIKNRGSFVERVFYKLLGIFFGKILSLIVIKTGRMNFSLVIAQKVDSRN
jgi:SAM-dependent methyltransferase